MDQAFQIDKFHINNHLSSTIIGDYYSGFNLEDQSKALCLLLNEDVLDEGQLAELQRVTLILAQQEHEGIQRPLAWGLHEGRHYIVYPDSGRQLGSYENLTTLPPAELLMVLSRLLKALVFAESKGIWGNQLVSPRNIRINLEQGEVKLSLFGWPAIAKRDDLSQLEAAAELYAYFPPIELDTLEQPLYQYDLYALGLIGIELSTSAPARDLLGDEDLLEADKLREKLATLENTPLPVRELFYKLLTPVITERYGDCNQALKDVIQLAGGDEPGLRFQTFILDTLINGRFQVGEEIAKGRLSRIYKATNTRAEEGEETCIVKLIDLRDHPEMTEVFHTRFKQLTMLHHDHLMEVFDVGVHFENGFIAMESGMQSLEQLLIKRGNLPLSDAGRIVFQLCKALEGLKFNNIGYHGAIKPSNVFLSQDLRTIKLADALTAQFFLEHGNLNFIGAEYFNPEYIKGNECDVRSDIYSLGILFFELMVGYAPFSFKIEQEIMDDHLNMEAYNRIDPALLTQDVKDIILRMLEKNPAVRYQTVKQLKEDLTVLLGYDKKAQVEIPNLFFDFSELSMVGKNTREKGEETLAVRLPAVNNRARGAIALLAGEGPELGDSAKASTLALTYLREMLFHPGGTSLEFAKLQKTDPHQFLRELVVKLNQAVYREAFSQGKTKRMGLSAVLGIVQENTLYLHQVGDADFTLFTQGEIVDYLEDKWSVFEEVTLGDTEAALSADVHNRLGFGEIFTARTLKRRLKDGDQLFLMSDSLKSNLSMSEVKELINSASEPAQAVELIRNDAIRRRLQGTISCVLLSIGNVVAFAEEIVSHAKKGVLARNFLAQGDSYLNDGRVDDAIEQYNRAVEINPNFSIIHHQLGMAYVRKGLSSFGLSCFERALELNAKLPTSYIEMVRILNHQKRQREVLPLLRGAVASGCKDAEVFALLAAELIKVRNYDEAVLYSGEALEINPAHPTALKLQITAAKRRNALDTKLLKMFGARKRLVGGTTKVEFKPEPKEPAEG